MLWSIARTPSSDLPEPFESLIRSATGASRVEPLAVIQDLWSGYGKILRLRLHGSQDHTVIAKVIAPDEAGHHPRGWNSRLSHQRKVKSYQVETSWYREWSHRCGPACRIPRLLAAEQEDTRTLLVLEDLDEAGFPRRLSRVTPTSLQACLDWLAAFHANFLGAKPIDLWETGTYWHLGTRSEELKALDDPELREAAAEIDQLLSSARYQTIVHGDAKLANFCFSPSGEAVAAVDFQYVGGGCGMKDLAYFVGSCLDESTSERMEEELLDRYFRSLLHELARHHPEIDACAVEADWRPLYRVAWVDFHRFLKGWSPGHWKINSYSERLVRELLASLTPPPLNPPSPPTA